MRSYVRSRKVRSSPTHHDRGRLAMASALGLIDDEPSTARVNASERARRASKVAHKATSEGKRRRIDPCTSDVNYDGDELEFMLAMQNYKEQRQRPFPTWKETLEVLRGLGYHKPDACMALQESA
jgi:hypothetical protein